MKFMLALANLFPTLSQLPRTPFPVPLPLPSRSLSLTRMVHSTELSYSGGATHYVSSIGKALTFSLALTGTLL